MKAPTPSTGLRPPTQHRTGGTVTDYQQLTTAEKAALNLGRRKGGVHVGTGRTPDGEDAPAKRVTKPVARRLIQRGLAVQHDVTLLTIDAGIQELAKPKPHEPVFFRERDGLTTQRHLAVRDEDEVQDVNDIKAHHKDDADGKRRDTAPRDRRGITTMKRAA